LSESPAESLKPDTEQLKEEITRCASIIGKMDAIIKSREEEISNLKSSLAGRDEIISEADEQISKLESEISDFAGTKKLYDEAMQEEIRGRNSREAYDLRQQQQISDLKHELEDAKLATQKLGDKNRELERGYGFKPNPIESKLRLEIGELQSQLSDLQENSAPAGKDLPESADLLNKLKGKRKKSKADLADIEAILEILDK